MNSGESGPMRRSFIAFFLFMNIIGLLGNYFRVTLFYGVDLIFGSIATVIVIKGMGKRWGLVTAVIVSSYTYFLWDHPYAIIIFAAEAFVLGELNERKKINTVLADLVFWVVVGTPLVLLFYHAVLGMDWTSTVLVLLKQSVNGIFNAFIAGIVIYHTPVKGLLPSIDKKNISLQHVLFNLVISLIIIPAIAFTVYEGRREFDRINKQIETETNHTLDDLSDAFQVWYEQQFVPLANLAEELSMEKEETAEIQKKLLLLKASFPSYHTLYVADKEGTTIAFCPEVNERGETTIGLNFADRLYYRKLKEDLKPYTSNVFIERGGRFSPIINIGVPIISEGKFDGYVAGALNLEIIQRLLDISYHNYDLNITVLDREKSVIASTSGLEVMSKYSLEDGVEDWGEMLYAETGGESSSRMMRWRQSSYIETRMINNGLGWQLIVERPIANHQTALFRIYIKILASTMGSLLVALSLSCYICSRIVYPLKKLEQLTGKLPEKISDGGTHESNGNINTSIAEIRAIFNNFKEVESELRDSFVKLNVKQQLLEYLAYHDPLTGLPNGASAKKHLQAMLADAKGSKCIYVMVIGIDNFKKINDGFGHHVGDSILKAAAAKLNSICCESCMAARHNGDEFLLIIDGLETMEEANHMAMDIINEFSRPFDVDGLELFVAVSVGISSYPNSGSDAETLIKYADMALLRAKRTGVSSYKFFDFGMVKTINRNLEMEEGLRKAIDKGRLFVYYQPQNEVSEEKVVGAEALLRWEHPAYGYIPPENFIAIAEETGLIIPLGAWVIDTVCETIRRWLDEGYNVVPVSINLSLLQLLHGNVAKYIIGAVEKFDIEPHYLRVEITETIGMSNMDSIVENLNKLAAKGIKVVLDDFGKRYSTFSYLQRLSIYSIKIDKEFIADIEARHNRAIIEAIIGIAHSLNIKVVAEGVEREEQLDYLRDRNCDMVQGYLYSEAVDRNTFEERFLDK